MTAQYLIRTAVPAWAALLAAIVGCGDITRSLDGDIHPIEGTLLFSFHDASEFSGWNAPEGWLLSMCTEKIYPCCNWSLPLHISRVDNRVIVQLIGVFEPDICLTALGPAGTAAPLETPSGEHVLRFVYDGMIDEYRLAVSDSTVAVEEVHASFTRPR